MSVVASLAWWAQALHLKGEVTCLNMDSARTPAGTRLSEGREAILKPSLEPDLLSLLLAGPNCPCYFSCITVRPFSKNVLSGTFF